MKFIPRCIAIGAALVLTACGGGGGVKAPLPEVPELPPQRPVHAIQAPTVALGDRLHVGSDAAAADQLLPVTAHGDATVFFGPVPDGLGAAELIAYLQADAASLAEDGQDDMDDQLLPGGLFLRFQSAPPTVRVVEGAPAELIDEAVRVIQLINAALPREWQLRFSREPGPAGTFGASDGEILVEFAAQENWSLPGAPPPSEGIEIGLAQPQYAIVPTGDPAVPFLIKIVAGQVWVDPTRTQGLERLGVIAHELLHVLGRNHADPARFPKTIMVAGGGEGPTDHVLHPLDREALLAAYKRLEPGTAPDGIADALGSWSDTSLHVRGVLDTSDGTVAFGTALRNGRSRPWASGATPDANLEANTRLSGSARWSGRLLGLTPQAEVVGGDADLTVALETLTGRMDFTRLESWAARETPGAVGTGDMWQDGNLSYGIEVRGNTFVQTGGDDGTLTGAFFGASHAAMGGVLERDDLSAGFGGKR